MKLKNRIVATAAASALLVGASFGMAAPAQAAQVYKEFATKPQCQVALVATIVRLALTSKILYSGCSYSSSKRVWVHIVTFKS